MEELIGGGNFLQRRGGQGVRICVNACIFVNLVLFSFLVKMNVKSAVENREMRTWKFEWWACE